MCQERNGSIGKVCKEAIFRRHGVGSMPNREMRRILKENGGCMTETPFLYGPQGQKIRG